MNSNKIEEKINKKIRKHLSSDMDADTLILKSHLLCEYYINELLLFKNICTNTKLSKITFKEKIELGLDRKNKTELKVFKELNALNKLRNRVGHELDYVLSESDVDSIGFIDGKDYIIRKYQSDDLKKNLLVSLVNVTVDIAVTLFYLIEKEIESGKEALPVDLLESNEAS